MESAIAQGRSALEQNFINLLAKLIRALNKVFPECERVLAALMWVRGVEADDVGGVMRTFYDTAKPFFEGLRANDDDAMREACDNIPWLRDLDMRAKFDEDDFVPSRSVLYKYLQNLVMYSRMAFEVDQKLMKAVEETARDLAAEIKAGRRDIKNLDLEEIGVQAIKKMEGGADVNDPKLLQKVNVLLELLTDNPMFQGVIDQAMKSV